MYCPKIDGDCESCEMFNDEDCMQDPDLGGTGHGDISYSDADSGL